MLPEVLQSSRQIYKSETNILINWVLKSAGECGFKAPKNKEKAGSVRRSDVLSQVELIVNSEEPIIQVPAYVIDAAKRAVSYRKSCSSWFRRYCTKAADDVSSNESHWAFIELLEDIIERLSRHSALQSSTTPAGSAKQQTGVSDNAARSSTSEYDATALTNLFSHLVVEEPEEPSKEGTPKSNTQRVLSETKQIAPSSLAEPLQSVIVEPPDVIVLCLYSDLKSLRSHVQELWTDYMSGKTDLLSVSITTNTAFVLARRWEDEVNSALPTARGAAKILKVLQIDIEGTDLSEYPSLTQESMYLAAYKHLAATMTSFPRASSSSSFSFPPLESGEYDSTTDRTQTSEAERFREDQLILGHLLANLHFLDTSEVPAPAKDELSSGLQDFLKKKKISVWATFATQILLDIVHITRPNMMKACDHVREVGSHMVDSLEQYLGSLSDDAREKKQEKVKRISHLDDHLRFWILTDVLSKPESKKGKAKASTPPEQPYFFFRYHPLLCGILATHYTLEFHNVTTAEAKERGLTYVMHVYNAVRYHKDYSVQAWPDMDLAIAIQTEEHLFIGGAPRDSMRQCGKAWTLHRGLPITSYASDARATPVRLKERRSFKEDSELVQILHSVYVDGSSIQTATGKIEHLLLPDARINVKTMVPSQPQPQAQPRWKAKKGKKGGKGRALKPVENDTAEESYSQKSSPEDFLDKLRAAVEKEIPALLLDYISLCSHSQRFIEAIQGSLNEEMANKLKAAEGALNTDMRTQSKLSLVCSYLISLAIDMEGRTTEPNVTEAEKKALLEQFAGPLSVAASRVVGEIGDRETGRIQRLLKETEAENVLRGLTEQTDTRES